MEIRQLLSKSLEKRFKVNCVIKELEYEICEMAKKNTFKYYQFQKYTKNEMEFELFHVKAHYDTSYKDDKKVRMALIYTVCSKLPKDKSDRLELFKERFRQTCWAEECNLKIPLWEELIYEVDIEDVLNNTISLDFDNAINYKALL